MIVTAGCTKILNERRVLFISSLFIIFGLTACSDSEPTSSVGQYSKQDALLAPQRTQLEVDRLDEPGLTSVVMHEGLLEQPNLDVSQASTELNQSMLESLSSLSQIQNQSIEANSVKELEQLSEADRQALQAIAAQKTMTAAERLAAKQGDKAALNR